MLRPIRDMTLVFITFFCFTIQAFEIIKVKDGRVLIRLDGKRVSVGEQLELIESDGRKVGVVKVTSFNATKALAKIESGPARVGMMVTRPKGLTSVKPDSESNFNVRLNPVGLIAGGIDGNFEYRITKDWTLGLQGIYLRASLGPTGIFTSTYNISAFGIGTRANWYFNGAFNDGFYFGPSVEYLNVNLKTTDAFGPASGSASGMMISGILGYGWFWDNFNIMVGGGYAAVLGASGITISDSAGNRQTITASLSGLTYELSIGWAF